MTGPSLAPATNWYGSEIGLVLAILFQVWPQHGINRIISFASVHLLRGEMLSYWEQQLQSKTSVLPFDNIFIQIWHWAQFYAY